MLIFWITMNLKDSAIEHIKIDNKMWELENQLINDNEDTNVD